MPPDLAIGPGITGPFEEVLAAKAGPWHGLWRVTEAQEVLDLDLKGAQELLLELPRPDVGFMRGAFSSYSWRTSIGCDSLPPRLLSFFYGTFASSSS